jgi:lipopolysaccharide transport system permease protein
VVFALPSKGLMAQIFLLNPLTPVVITARSWLTGSSTAMLPYFLGVGAAALVLLLIGWMLYRITMPVLIERMSS